MDKLHYYQLFNVLAASVLPVIIFADYQSSINGLVLLPPLQNQYVLPSEAICPEGWVLSITGDQSFLQENTAMCLYLSSQTQSWQQAKEECRASNSFLVSLEALVKIDGMLFDEFLQRKGIEAVWSGLHLEGGRLIWDEPREGIVKPYIRTEKEYGELKRGWSWDQESFNNNSTTCGLYKRVMNTEMSTGRKRRETLSTGQHKFKFPLPVSSIKINSEDKHSRGITGQHDKISESLKISVTEPVLADINDNPSKFPDDSKGKQNSTGDHVSNDDDDLPQDVSKRSTQTMNDYTTEKIFTFNFTVYPTKSDTTFITDSVRDNITKELSELESTSYNQSLLTSTVGLSLNTTRTSSNVNTTFKEGKKVHPELKAELSKDILNLFRKSLGNHSNDKDAQASGANATGMFSTDSVKYLHSPTQKANYTKNESMTQTTSKEQVLKNTSMQWHSLTELTTVLQEVSLNGVMKASRKNKISQQALESESKILLSTLSYIEQLNISRTETASSLNENSSHFDFHSDVNQTTYFFLNDSNNSSDADNNDLQTLTMPTSRDTMLFNSGVTVTTEGDMSTADSSSEEVSTVISTSRRFSLYRQSTNSNGSTINPYSGTQRSESISVSVLNDSSYMSPKQNDFTQKIYNKKTNEYAESTVDRILGTIQSPKISFLRFDNLNETLQDVDSYYTTTLSSTLTDDGRMLYNRDNLKENLEIQPLHLQQSNTTLASWVAKEHIHLMSRRNCYQEHHFVCIAQPVDQLRPVGHCERGWLGHGLLRRCYKPVALLFNHSEATQRCIMEGAKLALADNMFYSNVTMLLAKRLNVIEIFGKGIWLDMIVKIGMTPDGRCGVVRNGSFLRESCEVKLPFICQKQTMPHGLLSKKDNQSKMQEIQVIENMTSSQPQPLWCPVQTTSHDDVVIWYKDGKPIPPDVNDQTSILSTNSRSPSILQLSVNLLQRLGAQERYLLHPAYLQGIYWCKVWKRYPLQSINSYKIFVRFQDVITLHGFVRTNYLTTEMAIFFNEMGDTGGLPGIISRDMQIMNAQIFKSISSHHSFLLDIITIVTYVHSQTREIEFLTYLCLSRETLPYQIKGTVVDAYLKAFHTELIANEEKVRRGWNMTLAFEKAFRIKMTEMCPEARLIDTSTGYEATFPSTPVNERAFSREYCDGVFAGYAVCHGNLYTGAFWDQWEIDVSCKNTERTDEFISIHSNEDVASSEPLQNVSSQRLIPSTPSAALLSIDEVQIESGNVADVTDRLAETLDASGELNDVDVEKAADVIDRITVVPTLPEDVWKTLLQTVSKVLDTPLETLHKAQKRSRSLTRVLHDLDSFNEKLHFGQKHHIRYVTSNIVMELWDLQRTKETVIGFGAISGKEWTEPLTESNILTITNRTWADIHLSEFAVAIQLPEEVVRNLSGKTRLSMTIYRKAGLFLSSEGIYTGSQPTDLVNGAIISASLGGKQIKNLKEMVKLVFKPFKISETNNRCVFWDFNIRYGGGWSSQGCIYNGTTQGREICFCDHLTNFAVLLDLYGDTRTVDKVNDAVLSIITIIGTSLSILGLSLTIITFLFFRKLRQGRTQQTLFNMSVALVCWQAVLLVGLKQTDNYGVCLAVAILLHYFILVSFVWMLIEAVLQYLTFVKVLGTYISKFTLKTMLPAWGIPVIPIIVVLTVDYTRYRGRHEYCWMDLETFYYAFALPVGMIVLFNLVMFIIIMVSLLRRPVGLRRNQNKSQTTETNIKAALTIFILLGLTWIFGYLAIEEARLLFQYLFTIFSSMQGFFIFILLVARRRQVRDQWHTLCCHFATQSRKQKKVSPTISNSMSSNISSFSASSSNKSLQSIISHGSTKDSGLQCSSPHSN